MSKIPSGLDFNVYKRLSRLLQLADINLSLRMESTYSLLILVTTLFILLFKLSRPKSNPKLPPGPWQLPIVGSIHHLLGSQLPHHRFQQLSQTHGPLMHFKLSKVSMVVASSPEAAGQIMKNHDITFATRPLFPAIDMLTYHGKALSFAPYGDYWRQLRKMYVLELLSAKRVQSARLIRDQEAGILIQSIYSLSWDGYAVNLCKVLIQTTNNIMMRVVMGTKRNDFQDEFLKELYEAIELLARFDLSDLFPSLGWILSLVNPTMSRAQRCQEKLDQLVERIIQDHRARITMSCQNGRDGGGDNQVTEDLVDVLLIIQEKGDMRCELTDDGIKAVLRDVFGAGSETSASTLQWAMSELIRNPRVMGKAQMEVRNSLNGKDKVTEDDLKDLNYMRLVIKETLRMHPPVPLLLPRECQEKIELFGHEIPAKARVLVNVWAIGRDPSFWEDPEEFKPERFEGSTVDFMGTNFEFLPFGAGRRMCPGLQFGLVTVEFVLAQLLYYFDWDLPTVYEIKEKSLDMSEALGITSHRKFDLLLHAVPHIPYDKSPDL